MVFGDDDGPWNAGPLWIWKYMDYKTTNDASGKKVM